MAPVRKRLIVEGHVQGVGYRALVTLNARSLRIKGFVRNLPDETVEIVCEGEPEALADFAMSIDRKGDPADILTLNVTSIREMPPPEGELTRFHTDYGRPLSDAEGESLDREEVLVLRAGALNTNVNTVGQKVDSMHSDMNMRFDHMAGHYDAIATSLQKAIVHIDRNAARAGGGSERDRLERGPEPDPIKK